MTLVVWFLVLLVLGALGVVLGVAIRRQARSRRGSIL